jgi:transposase
LKVPNLKQWSKAMSLTTPSKSYANVEVYVGIDVHQRTYSVVAQVAQTIVKKWTTTAHPTELAQQLLKYFAGSKLRTVYEAGFSGFVLHRALVGQGIENIVVHPAAIEVAAHSRVKTDKRDAQKLASHLAAGRLRGIPIPSEAQEQHRLLSRTRSQLVNNRARIKIQIRMKAHQFGLIAANERREMSHPFVESLLAAAPSAEFKIVIQALWQVWKSLDEQIQALHQQLKAQAKADDYETTYRSAPAVGPISARVLSNELGNMKQFANERQLFSYTGLTPSECSSGDTIRKGHITKQGNKHLRAILIEIAWRAIPKDPDLQQFYQRLTPRVGSKRAIVAVARKLIGKIRAAFRTGQLYQISAATASLPTAAAAP